MKEEQFSSDYVFSDKYQPLFAPHKTRYILVKGGRGGGKSHALSSAVLLTTYDDACNVLYTRYTMTSAETSIIPEYQEKISVFNSDSDFYIKRKEIINVGTGATIFFRGLMQSSKNQIARLKSIHNVKWFIIDEAQELVDEALFDSIDLSIRTTDAENVIIIVYNPTDVTHWIYRRFYLEAGVSEDFNGVKDDVTYISTTYIDNIPNLSQSFLNQARKMLRHNKAKYDNIFLGHFKNRKEGQIYTKWHAIAPADYPTTLPQWYGIDWGYGGDPAAVVRMCYDTLTATLYLWQVCYKTGLLPRHIAKIITDDAAQLIHHYDTDKDTGEKIAVYYRPEDCVAYCDPARPEARDELRIYYGIDAASAVNRDKPARVAWLSDFNVCYVGSDIGKEQESYSFKPNPQDQTKFTEDPQDGNDHAMDATNYGAVTHLRRLGIENQCGEK